MGVWLRRRTRPFADAVLESRLTAGELDRISPTRAIGLIAELRPAAATCLHRASGSPPRSKPNAMEIGVRSRDCLLPATLGLWRYNNLNAVAADVGFQKTVKLIYTAEIRHIAVRQDRGREWTVLSVRSRLVQFR